MDELMNDEKEMPERAKQFDSNVFINCPFDSQYVPLLRAMIFSLHVLCLMKENIDIIKRYRTSPVLT